jgi:hypothetical protein
MHNLADENHKKFLSHLDESQSAVSVVAQWLSKHGKTVQIAGISKATNHADWKSNADNGDIFILRRIEVKRLSVHFTCRNDWPYKENFIVCARHAWDRAIDKPLKYVILNSSATHAAIVSGDTCAQWRTDTRTDSRYEGNAANQEFYFCPIGLVTFLELK